LQNQPSVPNPSDQNTPFNAQKEEAGKLEKAQEGPGITAKEKDTVLEPPKTPKEDPATLTTPQERPQNLPKNSYQENQASPPTPAIDQPIPSPMQSTVQSPSPSASPPPTSPTPPSFSPPAEPPKINEALEFLKKKKRPRIPFLLLGVALIILLVITALGLGLYPLLSKFKTPLPSSAKLTFWGVYEDEAAISELIKRYKNLHPNIEIVYLQKDPRTYEEELANALAENRGPDIWQIRNDEVFKHKEKLKEAPSSLGITRFLSLYPAVAAQDLFWPRPKIDDSKAPYTVVNEELGKETKIYGLPFSIDTLALFYNLDLLTKADIKVPPADWNDFVEAVKKTRIIEGNEVRQAGAALGLGKNIANASDILAVLLMQNHAVMVSSDLKSALFNNAIETSAGILPVGAQALDFYTAFARPNKEVYTWNANFESALKAFASGQVLFLIDYSSQIKNITTLAPSLRFDVAPLPQVRGAEVVPVNYAKYYVNVVSKASPNANLAWDFLLFCSEPENQEAYFNASKKPPALLSLIEKYKTMPLYGAFIGQTETAKSYFKGNDPAGVDESLKEAADNVALKNQPLQIALDKAAKQVTEILNASK